MSAGRLRRAIACASGMPPSPTHMGLRVIRFGPPTASRSARSTATGSTVVRWRRKAVTLPANREPEAPRTAAPATRDEGVARRPRARPHCGMRLRSARPPSDTSSKPSDRPASPGCPGTPSAVSSASRMRPPGSATPASPHWGRHPARSASPYPSDRLRYRAAGGELPSERPTSSTARPAQPMWKYRATRSSTWMRASAISSRRSSSPRATSLSAQESMRLDGKTPRAS